MTVYRVYKLREDGRISGPPHVIDCRDDETAMREARRLLRGYAREVWDLARLVGKSIHAKPNALRGAVYETISRVADLTHRDVVATGERDIA